MSELVERLNAALVGSYRLTGEVGAGGMATVFAAQDLQHPNILPLFDSGEAAGQLYFVMPYVEGPSLFSWLRERGQLPIGETIDIACTIAGALQHAHQQGVIHRDIKPENILLYDGVPVLVDFGLALVMQRAATRLTQAGSALGTVAYPSTSQLRSNVRWRSLRRTCTLALQSSQPPCGARRLQGSSLSCAPNRALTAY